MKQGSPGFGRIELKYNISGIPLETLRNRLYTPYDYETPLTTVLSFSRLKRSFEPDLSDPGRYV